MCKLKPLKAAGEKTYPFDLAFFNSVDAVTELIDTKFKNFYAGLEYDKEKKYWFNNKWDAIFNHEIDFTKNQFKERYDRRIKHLYEDFEDKSLYKFFILATYSQLPVLILDNLIKTLHKYNPEGNFILILISQNIKQTKYYNEKIYIINQKEKFEEISEWVSELSNFKTKQSKRIYNQITKQLKNIIRLKIS